ncbi:MAG: hypothetical protein JXO22_05385 [Phycisphaerae bacterium]|nr:hypothetical protein [Phycisphaerae bacterium]
MKGHVSAIDRAHDDIAAGDYGMARLRLASYLTSVGYDETLLRRLGELSAAMRDLCQAGRYWIGSSAEGESVERAIAAFVRINGGDKRRILTALPRAVQRVAFETLPSVAQARLREIGLEQSLGRLPMPDDQMPMGWRAWMGGAISVALGLGIVGIFVVGIGTVVYWITMTLLGG